MLFSTFITLTLFSSSLASPTITSITQRSNVGCTIATQLSLPPNPANAATPLSAPATPATAVFLGVGFQNYTCSSAGTFTSAGALANLFDISCLSSNTRVFNAIQDVAFTQFTSSSSSLSTFTPSVTGSYGYSAPLTLVGHHFFQPTATGGLAPVWDLRPFLNNPDAFVVGARVGDIPSPDGAGASENVDWLQLSGVQGGFADLVYRTQTRGGVAPASCTPGATAQVKYTAKYWFYDGLTV
ncbi:hypothetical protein CVT24_003727 [Panaeolus cyanescens]|uniref:Malate dehydrogenase n=1 Tax=Panaeolus cyanescens TaxID=181874 RepID=A0A409W8E9_9AGAR|nr:hypothetical protein CVT24_003727 [Panaeolus cyanescens]